MKELTEALSIALSHFDEWNWSEEGCTASIVCKMPYSMIHAEIQIARTAFLDQPFYVLKTDLQDFYPSIPHDLILTTLERYGVPEHQLAFFRKFLSIPICDSQ